MSLTQQYLQVSCQYQLSAGATTNFAAAITSMRQSSGPPTTVINFLFVLF